MKIRSDSMVGSDSYRVDQSFSDSEVPRSLSKS